MPIQLSTTKMTKHAYSRLPPRIDTMPGHSFPTPHRQRGLALVVALMLMLIVTLLGLAAAGGTIMQSKMTSNLYDRQTAFQNSEAALRAATEAVLNNPTATYIRDCSTASGNMCLGNPFTDSNLPANSIQTVASGDELGEYSAIGIATGQPQFVVEYMGKYTDPASAALSQTANATQYGGGGPVQQSDYYRITVRSGDPANFDRRALVILQSTVKR